MLAIYCHIVIVFFKYWRDIFQYPKFILKAQFTME